MSYGQIFRTTYTADMDANGMDGMDGIETSESRLR